MTIEFHHSLTGYPIRIGLALVLICFSPTCLIRAQKVNDQGSATEQETAGGKQNPKAETKDWIGPPEELVVYRTDFQKDWDAAEWTLLDDGWQHKPDLNPPVLSLFQKQSDFKPPHRSPLHMAILNQPIEGDFVIEVTSKSTHENYGHRDVCFFLGFIDPGHFYYVHLARNADPHANQIFIVNGEDRKSISLTTTEGTIWDDEWHNVRIRRDVHNGDITVWFDDLEKPVMTANDSTFVKAGQVGIGSFDDTADFSMFRAYKWNKPDPDSGLDTKKPVDKKSGNEKKQGDGTPS